MSGAVGGSIPLLTALLAATSVAVLLLPARRGMRPPPGGSREGDAGGEVGGRASARERRGRAGGADIGLTLTEVAALLRAGATPDRAWSRALGRSGVPQDAGLTPADDGVPPALTALAGGPAPSWLPRRDAGRWAWRPPFGGAVAADQAMRAAVPGAVAACRLTRALGSPLAGVLESVAEGVSEAGRARASRQSALSGPRTTARLLAALPLVALALGALVGAHPEDLLLGGSWGSALGSAGIGLMAVGHLLTRRLVRAAIHGPAASGRWRRGGRRDPALCEPVDEALVLDLATAALGAGASLPGVLGALGRALGEDQLGVVSRALLIGASWQEAWDAPEDAVWRASRDRLERCLRPGWEDGASPSSLLSCTAASIRAGRRAADEEAAERLAVRLVIPLGLCHLPAFVLLGIVPVVAGAGLDILAG
ncbi:hypothetical protein [Actinomyces gaoshouyii]|uniref:hypothetical protein n=1 Tax=Actinomyces gaoshouyii TaxID=1960083 RepID=UPI0009C10CCB|nr:hypothetical protein [Actinomyces gaoshouyii]ARD42433.1 hypothetical protein B6G06_08875 [Actinomyces gaoshouyii]